MSKQNVISLGLGGGCHWCTEAIFSSLQGINHLQQGWLSSRPPDHSFSEGILLDIDTTVISLADIINIHIETHSSRVKHSKRSKYRSAIYVKNDSDRKNVTHVISSLNTDNNKIITQVLPFIDFKPQSNESYKEYFFKKPDKPFCKTYIHPKLRLLLTRFKHQVNDEKIALCLE